MELLNFDSGERDFELVDSEEHKRARQFGSKKWSINYNRIRARLLENETLNRGMLFIVAWSVLLTALWPPSELEKSSKNADLFATLQKYVEPIFVVIFDVEVLLKVWLLGWAKYTQPGFHKFEVLLAVLGTANYFNINSTPGSMKKHTLSKLLKCIPVLRIVRLVRISSTLESFISKIFGPAKKMALLMLTSISIVVSMSLMSLQLFSSAPPPMANSEEQIKRRHFRDFAHSFMAMFQVLTQEGWVDVMHDTMEDVNDGWRPLVTIYFILYHLFATTVLLSMFVAVILDNLELEEELKKLKQLKMRQVSADKGEKLSLRIRIFERFKSQPEMVKKAENVGMKLRGSSLLKFHTRETKSNADLVSTLFTESTILGSRSLKLSQESLTNAIYAPAQFVEFFTVHQMIADKELCRFCQLN